MLDLVLVAKYMSFMFLILLQSFAICYSGEMLLAKVCVQRFSIIYRFSDYYLQKSYMFWK